MYLNKNIKNNILIIAFAGACLGDYAEKIPTLTTDEKRRLKTAGTHCMKVFQSVVDRLDRTQCKSMMNQLQHNDIRIVAKSEVTSMNHALIEDSDEIYTLAEFAINDCCNCKQGEEIVSTCRLRQTLLKLDVPIAREPKHNGECPYTINEV